MLAKRLGMSPHGLSRPRAKFEGEIIEAREGELKIALLCPLTYMNLSGRSVKAAVSFYQIPIEQLLIVCDDFNLDLGRIRIRPGGSSGGQNGLSDVIEKLGTDQVPRLRFGIGKPPPRWDVKNFVLSKFDADDREIADVAIERAVEAVHCWIKNDIQIAMNRFNSSPQKANKTDDNSKDDSDSNQAESKS